MWNSTKVNNTIFFILLISGLSLQVLKIKTQDNFKFPVLSDISVEEDRSYWLNMKDSLLLPHKAIEDYAKNGKVTLLLIKKHRLTK